jgi:uncharacterized membrane protein
MAGETRRNLTPARSRGSGWPALDVPREAPRGLPTPNVDAETFGRWSERFARFMGTAQFLVGMTVFVALWLVWNTWTPWQFDPRHLNYTLLTLILSLQASYAAPLILLAQNRQADRDRVSLEQDRQRAERALADTEYLAREVAALRIALREVATRDFVRSELRALLEELDEAAAERTRARTKKDKRKDKRAAQEPDGPDEEEAADGLGTERDEGPGDTPTNGPVLGPPRQP